MLTALLLSACAALPPQNASTGQADLDAGPLNSFGAVEFRLRSTEIGAPARILLGAPSLRLLAPPSGVLFVHPGAAYASFTGTIGADGLFTATALLPDLSAFAGATVIAQGGLRAASGSILTTAPRALTPDAAASAGFTNASGALPASNFQESGIPAAADFDRDGRTDLVATGVTGLRFYRNSGAGLVDETAARIPAADNPECYGVLAADFNADGHDDLATWTRFDNGVALPAAILHNDGAGSFGSAPGIVLLPITLAGVSDLAAGDVDGDGDLDLIACDGAQHNPSTGPQVLALLRDQGGLQGGTPGTYAEDAAFKSAAFNVDFGSAAAVALGDCDNDGDLDLAVARTTGGGGVPNLLVLNDGIGGFTDVSATQLPFFLDRSSDAQFADLDGDGYLDLLFMNSHVSITPANSGDVLYNLGASNPGHYADGAARFPDQFIEDLMIRLYSQVADVDADGDLDVLIQPHEFFGSTRPFVGYPALFVNQGGAQGGARGDFAQDGSFFRTGAQPWATFISSGAAFLDLDRDGDLDLYVGSKGGIVNPAANGDWLLRNALR
jgi:hypothetical protein